MARSRLAAIAMLMPAALPMVVRPKLETARSGGSFAAPAPDAPTGPSNPRDVLIKVYDISTPEARATRTQTAKPRAPHQPIPAAQLCSGITLLTGKRGLWFPKLTCGVGGRVWSYDGEVERTVDAIVEGAARGPPLRTYNLGPTESSDAEIDAMLEGMGSTDYSPEEYDFFYRNCNHFCYDMAERLNNGPAPDGYDEFIDHRVLAESESLLINMGGLQQSMTRAATFALQKLIIKAWRKEWKRALEEYEAEHPEEATRAG